MAKRNKTKDSDKNVKYTSVRTHAQSIKSLNLLNNVDINYLLKMFNFTFRQNFNPKTKK